MNDKIRVVSGAVVFQGRVLMTQRSESSDFPWIWELPGGKVEQGESDQEALRRELLEELGANTTIGPLLWRGEFTPADGCKRACEVLIYRAFLGFNELLPRWPIVAAGLGWFHLPVDPKLVVPSLRHAQEGIAASLLPIVDEEPGGWTLDHSGEGG
jgi:8-oxo-dGTP pyrophosphatase MutT (NUDIX family)